MTIAHPHNMKCPEVEGGVGVGGEDSHMERSGMHLREFELNP